jgi:hypothetical protein
MNLVADEDEQVFAGAAQVRWLFDLLVTPPGHWLSIADLGATRDRPSASPGTVR